MDANYYVQKLGLQPHPEGGFFKETYRSTGNVNDRNYSTAIYFLLTGKNFSALHRIKSDEVWHFYAGSTVNIVEITLDGALIETKLGNNLESGETFQYTVSAGHWFGSHIANWEGYALVGCTVAPGFDFRDFEMADREQLKKEFMFHVESIERLTR